MNTQTTPETDEIRQWSDNHGWIADIDCARKLERERDEAREIIDAALKALPVGYIPAHTIASIPERIEDLCKSIVEAESELATVTAQRDEAREELTTVTAQREWLAQALARTRNMIQTHPEAAESCATEALQSLTPTTNESN
jgi:chromosome segregation ATPase